MGASGRLGRRAAAGGRAGRARPGPVLLLLLLATACGGERLEPVETGASASEPTARPGAAETAIDGAPAREAAAIGFPVHLEGPAGIRLGLLPTGAYTMGSGEDAPGHRPDETPHPVRIVTPCYLQLGPVTNGQYRHFDPAHAAGASSGAGAGADDDPVVGVTHAEAEAFAAWLAEQDPRWAWRLPTEAEWEHACRAGSGGAAPAGARWGFGGLDDGLGEWCRDRYGAYASWAQDDPQGPVVGDEHVVRGLAGDDGRVRCAARAHFPAGWRGDDVGFRVVAEVGYGSAEHGRHPVTYVTVDPSRPERPEVAGYRLRMIGVVKRLTDRQRGVPVTWLDLPGRSPISMRLRPGRYYVYAWRLEDGEMVRGIETKFDIPDDGEVIHAMIPPQDQGG